MKRVAALAALLLTTACGAGPADFGPGPDGAGDDDCGACRARECGPSEEACGLEQDCTMLSACLDSCADEACSRECVRSIPSYRAGQPLRQCVADSCSAACGSWR